MTAEPPRESPRPSATLPRPRSTALPHYIICSCGRNGRSSSIMALSLGPDSHPPASAGSGSRQLILFLFLLWKKLSCRCKGWTVGRPQCRRLRSRAEGGGWEGPEPLLLLFSPASSLATPSSGTSPGEEGAASPGTQAPAPPRHVPPPTHTHCPQRLGGGGCNARPAPPQPRFAESLGRPYRPRRIRTLAVTTPTPQRTAGRGGGRLTVMCGMLFLPW